MAQAAPFYPAGAKGSRLPYLTGLLLTPRLGACVAVFLVLQTRNKMYDWFYRIRVKQLDPATVVGCVKYIGGLSLPTP